MHSDTFVRVIIAIRRQLKINNSIRIRLSIHSF